MPDLTPLHELAGTMARASELAFALKNDRLSDPERLSAAVAQAEAAIDRWRTDQELSPQLGDNSVSR